MTRCRKFLQKLSFYNWRILQRAGFTAASTSFGFGEVEVEVGRVGQCCHGFSWPPQLAFLAQHSKSAGAWPGYGQQAAAAGGERQAAPTWTHNPAFSHLLPPQAVHCIVAYAAYIFYLRCTLSLCVPPL